MSSRLDTEPEKRIRIGWSVESVRYVRYVREHRYTNIILHEPFVVRAGIKFWLSPLKF